MKAAFIGLGLIGGSMAKRLKASGLIQTAIGVDTNPEHARIALENGIVNRIDNLESAIDQADFIVLSVPVSSAKNLITAVLDRIQKGSVVIDTGSTKLSICKKASYHQNRDQFVAFHPIAGTEYSGPNAADENLFSGKLCIICEQDRSSSSSLAKVLEMIEHLGMEVIHMNAEEHDRHLAYVSHLSHITSFTLGLTVLEIEKNEKNIFNLAGSGFSSTARLAKSSPEMWAPIFQENCDYLYRIISEYIRILEQFRRLIIEKDSQGLLELMGKANEIREILENLDEKDKPKEGEKVN